MTDKAGTLELDAGELTMGDLEDIEVTLGWPMAEAAEHLGGQIRLARAMVWIRRRRLDPSYTFEDTAQIPTSVMTELAEQLGGDDTDPPAQPSTA